MITLSAPVLRTASTRVCIVGVVLDGLKNPLVVCTQGITVWLAIAAARRRAWRGAAQGMASSSDQNSPDPLFGVNLRAGSAGDAMWPP